MKKLFTSVLEIPLVWRLFRKTLDIFFGLYRKRKNIIRSFGITNNMSIIDIGCGTGQYSGLTNSRYLGIDMEQKYIETAEKLYKNENKRFLNADVNTANISDSSFDAAILIDATHHLSDEENRKLMKTLNRVTQKSIIICDPIQQTQKWNIVGLALIALDRGNYIRAKKELLSLIKESLNIEKIIDMKIMGIEGVCVLARPRK